MPIRRHNDHIFPRVLHLVGMLVVVWLLCMVSTRPVAAQALPDADLYKRGYQAYTQNNRIDASLYLQAYVLRSPERYRNDPNHHRQVDSALDYARAQIQGALQCTAPSTASVTSYYVYEDPRSPISEPTGPSYPLVCRGGGEMSFDYMPSSDLSDEPQVWISFTPAVQGVGMDRENVTTLQPGECSWLDRAISPAEPQTNRGFGPALNSRSIFD